jgi:hypothetical protein
MSVIVCSNAEKRALCPSHGENRGSSPLGSAKSVQAHGAAGMGAMTRQGETAGHSAKYRQHNMDRSEQPPSP